MRRLNDPVDFRSSASKFRAEEEASLKIRVDDIDNMFVLDQEISNELLLQNFGYNEILTFNSRNYPDLSSNQKRFIGKLKRVIINNSAATIEANFEKLIDDMTLVLYENVGLDDGDRLTMGPCNIGLSIGDSVFATHADREGRVDDTIVWLMCEDKHVRSLTYKHGEVQLICSMIGGHQFNIDKNIPIYGIRVVADNFWFYRMVRPDRYIEEIYDGIPISEIHVQRYPNGGLKITDASQRRTIIQCLNAMRSDILSLNL
ncbi:hypothetical protein CONCODRAFT_3854 [Conidiobolus coronatus NRRL 28638]|uniref:Uncharacterized protein n=1 Tax=Conidiobolus coronatus (strain ATCC 28846 / CBS 209.66 / NRRL 28638) TaxID=796925 RepID=A0A137PDV8_CONC2|nr:hypothetical protein CONCODRAFT_3854 [Conidiobolus coronatus NRRL 28638]|eukprot:KXN73189.1 hypothetical protein CONCODRAFT_3854 [Conidiobolus coronatus NRRL 28638]